ncbi:MAG: hypothetical protein JNK77_03985 [Saprospiraceae bacterium]|nr:hypothetical protein [Saprospiraceae bacterium]
MKKVIKPGIRLLEIYCNEADSNQYKQSQNNGGRIVLPVILTVLLFSSCITNLNIVTVSAPAINCIFDSDCNVTANDTSDDFVLSGMAGSGFLQSRTLPVGEAGTPGAGLYAYEYRIDLRQMAGLTHLEGVKELSLDFGPVSSLDYNGDGSADDVYVITAGGLGTVAPSSAVKSGNRIIFKFGTSIYAGNAPGNGQSSFFFGIASRSPAYPVEAHIVDTQNNSYTLDARAPNFNP